MTRIRLRPDIALAFVCVGLYVGSAAQVRTSGGRSALALAVTAIAAPPVALGNAVGTAWQEFKTGRASLSDTLAELERLRRENGELRRANQLLGAEAAALRQGSRLLASYPSLAEHAVLARVVARDVVRTHTLRLDRGSADGIRLDSPVLANAGLVGRVDQVLAHSSRVQLLTHPAAAAAAAIAGVPSEGLLTGGDPPRVTSLPPYTKVAPDARVTSTGSEGIYPPGLLFGTAMDARNDGLFTVVPVRLAARPTDVTVVLVLAPLGRSGQ